MGRTKIRLAERLAAIALSAATLLGALPLTALASPEDSKELEVAVWSDVHVLAPELMGDWDSLPENADFQAAVNGDRKMFAESASILDAAASQLIADAPDALIIPGDLTKDGERASHEYLAARLNAIKAQLPDLKIYVINGNHDVANWTGAKDYSSGAATAADTVTPAEFREIYAGLGYGDSDAVYFEAGDGAGPGSLSYAARIAEGFTVIVLDSCKYQIEDTARGMQSDGAITPELMAWALEQAAEARGRGDAVIGVEHHNLVPHFDLEPQYFSSYLIDNYAYDSRVLADGGFGYFLTGHMHANDIAQVTTRSGNTLYDIETGSLVTYPSPTRLITFAAG
ncbi:MAG: metallophosphoesterase, partial [Clostridiales bacterium]|nr:metallophosphoesterase [Clostridiales bacterium]